MARAETARQRFRGFVELSGLDRPYISKAEERRLLEQGMAQFELGPDEARTIVFDVAHVQNIKLEREIDRRILNILLREGGKKRKIGRGKFNQAANLYRAMAGGVLTDEEARGLVKQVMDANQFLPRRGGLTMSKRWYNRVGNDTVRPRRFALLTRDI